MSINSVNNIAVIGSGTMGVGIAQVFVQNGFSTVLYDINEEQVLRAKQQIEKRLNRLVEKGKMSAEVRETAQDKLYATTTIDDVSTADLVIEAAPEKLEIKSSIFQQVEEICKDDALFATNTSSLSITEIQAGLERPEKLAGLHFFNPAPLMPLVEVVQGLHTANAVTETLQELAERMEKVPVLCRDTPGFIVNRVARPFYNEALRILNDNVASVEQIDRIMKKSGNFKMGPFELQDLIGIDINFATTTTVHNSFHGESRFRPQHFQERMVQAGRLGRKTKGGFYDYE
ncbi:3-hydroxybutyryl-CoA dehydrogenase [Alteribacillus persepolensis]|uniref:3-hydroxybutyryl-CoA dehydrogenase n=1 Tax=Alteribacillus persepolensis TaxID=568899 RepID=A0A1G8KCU3_9BACI|nr:3-hydroxyacyl-CoA dehydrogenase NAD-binding domain-containing protein [Alteribacillus persepolensis]SDI41247.1 3-hydroxybutyryl-CoA dehydrogenase [Alteribacillus persepolensis]